MNISKAILSTIFFIITAPMAIAESYLPSELYLLDSKFTHHVILVEKSSHTLHLYKNNNGVPELLKVFSVATGKFRGNKFVRGDHKTPEGIYTLQKFHASGELISKYGDYGKIYGAGAFTTNYPNVFDRRAGKTGGGIWLHSTDDNARISKGLDSKGCVVVVDEDLKAISQYIDLKSTPMVIVENISYESEQTWKNNREELKAMLGQWMKAWQEKDFDKYINSYSKTDFYDSSKGNYIGYKNYKKLIFSRSDKPIINFSNISILHQKNHAVVHLQQDYSSDLIQDVGRKTLYLKKDENYDWKIIAEHWSKLDLEQRNLAFVPSMRFFKEETKEQ